MARWLASFLIKMTCVSAFRIPDVPVVPDVPDVPEGEVPNASTGFRFPAMPQRWFVSVVAVLLAANLLPRQFVQMREPRAASHP